MKIDDASRELDEHMRRFVAVFTQAGSRNSPADVDGESDIDTDSSTPEKQDAIPTIREQVEADSSNAAYSPEGHDIHVLLKREQCTRLAMRGIVGLLDPRQRGLAARLLCDAGLAEWMGYGPSQSRSSKSVSADDETDTFIRSSLNKKVTHS
ncbi:MAG: hypothetical protein VB141_11315 [Burkholderia gladioli]